MLLLKKNWSLATPNSINKNNVSIKTIKEKAETVNIIINVEKYKEADSFVVISTFFIIVDFLIVKNNVPYAEKEAKERERNNIQINEYVIGNKIDKEKTNIIGISKLPK